jgi:hypothetical protein
MKGLERNGRSIDLSHRSGTPFPDFLTAAILLIFDSFGRHISSISNNSRSRRLVSRIENQTRVPDVEEDRGERDHTVKMSQSVDSVVRSPIRAGRDEYFSRKTYTLSNPTKAHSSWKALPSYPSLNS